MKVKTILVSQPEPKIENSPYFDLIEKQKVKIDFRPFIHVEGVSGKDVRAQKLILPIIPRLFLRVEILWIIILGLQTSFVLGASRHMKYFSR